MCHFQTLRFSAIVWYAIQLNFNLFLHFLKDHKCRPQGPLWSVDHSLRNTAVNYLLKQAVQRTMFTIFKIMPKMVFPLYIKHKRMTYLRREENFLHEKTQHKKVYSMQNFYFALKKLKMHYLILKQFYECYRNSHYVDPYCSPRWGWHRSHDIVMAVHLN